MSFTNSFTPLDHSDDQQLTKPIVNNINDISNSENDIVPSSSELDRDMLSTNNDNQQNSNSTETFTTDDTTTTDTKKVFKKKPTVNPNYILFGYIPNYKIPIINIPISYPIDVISNKVRYITSKIGFGEKGITKKSIASRLQSFIYGGKIPKQSVFSYIQSFSSKKSVERNVEVESISQQSQQL